MQDPKSVRIRTMRGTDPENFISERQLKDKNNISYLVHLYSLIRLINRSHCTIMRAIKGGQEDELY
jgi:hypothetical protein